MGRFARGTLKKLIGAARYWLCVDKPPVRPLTVDDGVADGMRFFGVSEADIVKAQADQAAPEDEGFEVYEDCWESVMFFLKVQTQWVFRGMDAARTGLNYPAVESAMNMDGIKRQQRLALFADVRVMERAVLRGDAGLPADELAVSG